MRTSWEGTLAGLVWCILGREYVMHRLRAASDRVHSNPQWRSISSALLVARGQVAIVVA